jgi:hypothetical protein
MLVTGSLSAAGIAAANDNGQAIGSGSLSVGGSALMSGDSTLDDIIATGAMTGSATGSLANSGAAYAGSVAMSAGFGLFVGDGCAISEAALTAGGVAYMRGREPVLTPPSRTIANDLVCRKSAGQRIVRSITGPARADRSASPNLQRRGVP